MKYSRDTSRNLHITLSALVGQRYRKRGFGNITVPIWSKTWERPSELLFGVGNQKSAGFHGCFHRFLGLMAAMLFLVFPSLAATCDPLAADYNGRVGQTLCVSKLGDDSDVGSWKMTFRLIQVALRAVPDAEGGHRIIVHPATYRQGSLACDRWIFRGLYVTGGDAGLFWDLTDKSGEGFTVVAEDCVGIGRAFGGGVCYPTVRPAEPSLFRRCYFLALDWVGDTAAVLVGGWEKTMPQQPHAVFEDCTMVHPDNAVALSYASHCARARFLRCQMIVLNFTQPEMGGKSTGILCTEKHRPEGRLHVDLEDCLLAGYSLFTPGPDGQAISYTTQGRVRAYLQFKQTVPDGFVRLGQWPVELFAQMAPPKGPGISDGKDK